MENVLWVYGHQVLPVRGVQPFTGCAHPDAYRSQPHGQAPHCQTHGELAAASAAATNDGDDEDEDEDKNDEDEDEDANDADNDQDEDGDDGENDNNDNDDEQASQELKARANAQQAKDKMHRTRLNVSFLRVTKLSMALNPLIGNCL